MKTKRLAVTEDRYPLSSAGCEQASGISLCGHVMNTLLPIGTNVHHTGHGDGVIVSYNGVKANTYAMENLGSPEISAVAVKLGLGSALVNSFYSGDLYPYVVQFKSGYKDVYAPVDLTAL